jgi:hypothetical protein
MVCRPRLTLLAAAVLAGAAYAQPRPGPTDAACRDALKQLETLEADLLARRPNAASAPAPTASPTPLPAALTNARQRAARACLGGRGDTTDEAATRWQPPLSVPPIKLPNVSGVAPPPRPGVPLPPAPANRPAAPTIVTSCDSLGCWTSDGQRLPHAGHQQLLGPRGICSVNGAVVQCP